MRHAIKDIEVTGARVIVSFEDGARGIYKSGDIPTSVEEACVQYVLDATDESLINVPRSFVVRAYCRTK